MIYLRNMTNLQFFQAMHHISDPMAQNEALMRKKLECWGLKVAEAKASDFLPNRTRTGAYCKRVWDNLVCWPPTTAGELAVQPCPDYVSGLTVANKASRQCMPDGTWFYNNATNSTWTNFSQCLVGAHTSVDTVPDNIKEHLQSVRIMYNIGYGLSMVSLVIAVIIMLCFKKLHCARNAIHINLFISFILRAAVSFIKENLLLEFVGFSGDFYYDEDGAINFREDVSHWECRLFFTLYNYIIAANYVWIFVEAVYLQMLISISVFTEKNRTRWYMVFGWCFPLTFIIPWVFVRIYVYNEFCWNVYYKNKNIMFIIYGPILISVIIQFIIFINIVRILFTKLHASSNQHSAGFRYRRLAKSTLILIPLFGVYYIIFSISSLGYIDEKSVAYLVLWWAEMFFNSFQGFILSMLFCFFNAEVQAEFKKIWRRHTLQLGVSTQTSRLFLTRSRTSSKKSGLENGINDRSCNASSPVLEELKSLRKNSSVQEDLKDINETCPCLNNNLIVENGHAHLQIS